jgi:hypothetical protein
MRPDFGRRALEQIGQRIDRFGRRFAQCAELVDGLHLDRLIRRLQRADKLLRRRLGSRRDAGDQHHSGHQSTHHRGLRNARIHSHSPVIFGGQSSSVFATA